MIDPAVRPPILTAFANNDESLGAKYSHRISGLRRTLGALQRVEAAPTRSDENARLRPERSALREGYSDDDGRRFLSTGSVLAGAHSAAAISEAASAYKPSPCRFPTGTGSELRIRTVSALSTDLGQRISPTKSLTFTTDVSAETSNAWSRSRDASGSRHVPRGTSTTLR